MLSIKELRNGFTKALFSAMLFVCLIAMNTVSAQTELRWWKGNLHTHIFWSDGDDFPEMVVQWYQAHGYVNNDAEGKEIRTTRRYSAEIGAVLAEVEGTTAQYPLRGDEIYVRAKVIASRKNDKSHVPAECESAWVQPIVVR